MMTRMLFLISVLFILSACSQEEGQQLTLIEGRVVHPDGQPAANTPLVVGVQSRAFDNGLPDLSFTRSFDIIHTDNQGGYQYSFISQEGNRTVVQPYGMHSIDSISYFYSCKVDQKTAIEGERNAMDFTILPNSKLRLELDSYPNADSVYVFFDRSNCRTFQEFQELLGPKYTAPYVVPIWPRGTYDYVLHIYTSPLSLTEKRGTFTVADEAEIVLRF
jgi:hypothetical protein